MNQRRYIWLILTLLLVLAWTSTTGAGEPPEEIEIDRPVVDRAGVLSDRAVAEVERRIYAHHENTGVQLAVLTVNTTGDHTIEAYSLTVAERWGGGSVARDDGMLFTLAVDDRENRIEVGYGLESMVPDSVAAQILDGLAPSLRAEDYDGAVIEAVDELIGHTEGGVAGIIKRAQGGVGGLSLALILLVLGATGLTLGSVSRVWMSQTEYNPKVVIAVVCLGIVLPASSGALLLFEAHPGVLLLYAIAIVSWFAVGTVLGNRGLWLSYILIIVAVVAVSLAGPGIVFFDMQPVVMWPSLALLTWTFFYMTAALTWVSEQADAPRAAEFWVGFFKSTPGGGSNNTMSRGAGSSGGGSYGGGGGSFGGGGASGSW